MALAPLAFIPRVAASLLPKGAACLFLKGPPYRFQAFPKSILPARAWTRRFFA